MRPHGLLKGVIMEPGSYEYTSKAQTIETWCEEKSGHSELDFGVRMRHGRLVVPRSGLYQVFSHIYFSEDTDPRKSNNTELEHKMYKFNILHEDSGEEELLQAGLTPCLQSQKWQPQEENAGSYAGAITHLQAGDEISVRVTYIHFLEGCKGEHYFGLHKIGS
ncbi:tumor necrosis factor ligand superfamily member 6-like [Liolophura sinensis]|uniref:tumor necrosis factor ligand superfamily member 6-like n=1 Tax=Liolophura sinensis TaxID=3198878 RepID=UPI0031592CE9